MMVEHFRLAYLYLCYHCPPHWLEEQMEVYDCPLADVAHRL